MKYNGPKAKKVRRQGMNLYGSDKYDKILQRKPYGPGKSPKDRPKGKPSEYSRQLLEKGQAKLEQLLKDIGGPQNITEENFPEVHIRGDVNTPYQCIGGVIYTMQYAGFQKIGFISEPAAGSGTLGRL